MTEVTECAECGREFDPVYLEPDDAPDMCAACNAKEADDYIDIEQEDGTTINLDQTIGKRLTAAGNGHVLTLETLVAMDAALLQSYDDDPWPWPPYGVSERDEPDWIRMDARHPADAATNGGE